jgi:hypothetical protein
LPLYALSLIFPYRSYIATLAQGIGDHIDLGEGLPRVVPVFYQTKARGAGPGDADARTEGIQKSAWVPPSLPWPTSPAGSIGTLKCTPRPPPGKINLRRTGPLTARPQPAKRPPQGKGPGPPVKCLNRLLKAVSPEHILLIKFLALGPITGGVCYFPLDRF